MIERLKRWVKQKMCAHRRDDRSSPAGQDFVDLLQGKITMEQYRKRNSPLYVSTCLDCGKVTEKW